MKTNKIVKLIFIITIFLICIDQLSKIILKYKYIEPIEGNFFGIVLIENDGIAFGMNSGNIKNIILTGFVLLIIINFIRNQKDRIDKKTATALGFILAGGISNLIDRIIRGGVLDFIKIQNFAIFNIADIYIVIGFILLVIFVIKFSREIGEKDCKKD